MSGRERGWSGDLRRSPKAPLNVPSVDPDDQLESVGATPLAPTSLTRLLTEHAAHRGYPAPGLSLTSAGRVRRVTISKWHLRFVRATWSAAPKVGCYSVVIAETAIRSSA